MGRRNRDFQTIRSEGGLLPPDLLRRVLDPKAKLAGTEPSDYGLPPGERLNEVITQSWNRLRKHWADFRAAARNLPKEEAGTGLTNDKWSVPLLRELGFGMLPTSSAPEINGKTYAINRFFGATAVHLIGCQLDLDKRVKGVRGAAIANPHGLVQDFLNRSDTHLWAILSNGLQLRILRDSQAISRQSYLEFDLEATFDGEVFADFVLLWLLAHSTRFAARENDRPETCWLEQWTKEAEEQGTRALGDLRQGVEKALEVLGQGFVSHPKNAVLRDALRSGQLTLTEFHGQLLRVVYRLIFLFVAEDRTLDGMPLLHAPDDSEAARVARERYAAHYSAGRLRDMAGSIRGGRHGDLWWQLNLVVGALSGDVRFNAVREQLALPTLGSFLWSPDSTAALNAPSIASNGTALANADLLEAIRNLAFTRQNHALRPVDYKNLGAEELGGVYESLLALTPQISSDGAKFTFAEFAGNERKTSGSYYTPDSLVQCLLDSALEPVIEEAVKSKNGTAAERALLSLKVCDPAVGSGHFLVGAAHRLARHLARIRAVAEGEGEPSPRFYQHALRDVIGRCLYGVDINPMAAELCRVSLWLEALEPGKPLSFLDHHVRVGNSLFGTTPKLIEGGLPEEAFTAIEGDDKKVCSQLKKRNKAERAGFDQQDWVGGGADRDVVADLSAVTREASELDATADDTVDAVQRKADQFRRLVVSSEYTHAQQVADAWCAAFVWPKTPSAVNEVVTTGAIQRLAKDPRALSATQVKEVERLSSQYQFFHWHLAFPEVFAKGGFDCVLGNPPWEKFTVSDEEWFAGHDDDIASTKGKAARDKKIAALEESNPLLYERYRAAKRDEEVFSKALSRGAGTYPLTGFKELNTYHLFAELAAWIVGAAGRVGLIVKTGIASAENCLPLFKLLTDARRLVSLFDFVNKKPLFPGVQTVERFSLVTIAGERGAHGPVRLATLCVEPTDLLEPGRTYALAASDIALMSPINGACPLMRGERDAVILRKLYREHPILGRKDPDKPNEYWNAEFTPIFHMANDSAEFRKREELASRGYELRSGVFVPAGTPHELSRWNDVVDLPGYEEIYLPLYEGKYIYVLEHRYGTFDSVPASKRFGRKAEAPSPTNDQLADPTYELTARYWYPRTLWLERATARALRRDYAFYFRDVAGVYPDLRTAIGTIGPATAAGDKAPCLTFPCSGNEQRDALRVLAFAGLFSSLAFDYVVRNKLFSKSLKWNTLGQIVMPRPRECIANRLDGSLQGLLAAAVLELTYTSWSLASLGRVLGVNSPFVYRRDRRFVLHRLIDGISAHLFGLSRGDVEHILDTFETLAAYEMKSQGKCVTREHVLSVYDGIAEAKRRNEEYKPNLDPSPADPRCCHTAQRRGLG